MALLVAFFREHPCAVCGEADPGVLEFHHLGSKSFNVAHGFRDRPWKEVVAEIAKCEVRCGNCHKLHTGPSLGWYRALVLADASTPGTDAEEP